MTLVNKLTAIGDAIREKTGGTAELTLDQMVTEIGGITGGGEVDTSVVNNIITRSITSYTNNRVTELRSSAFNGSSKLQTVSLPKVIKIGDNVFGNCSVLTSLDIPLVTETGSSCFSFCSVLTEIDLQYLTTLGSGAFHYCKKLQRVSLPLVSTIGSSTFNHCENLTDVNLPSVTAIDANTFMYCTALTKLELPALTEMAASAFNYASKFETLILSNTVGVVTLKTSSFSNNPIASGTGYIYVPDELVEDYKVATNWVNYANQIKPLSEYVEVS